MKRIALLVLLSVLISSSVSFAQDTDHSQCGSDHIMEKMLENDEGFLRKVFIMNRKIAQLEASGAERSNTLYTIPVVVHVIHEGEPIGQGSNISDEQIYSAIDGMNEDFRKMVGTNGDGDGVDVRIEFCLARRTPEGESTNGIVRVDGSVVPNYAEEGIRASGNVGAIELDIKALSTWDRTSYMNIWVVNEIEDNNAQNGIQGYAYFPVDHPVDGIVCLHNAFGTVGNLKPNTALNRTLTHEAGHYFGLYHTFNDTNDCEEEINCNTQGDRVCDTPVTPIAVSCSSPACSGNQQVENYMDYTAEVCRNMFTDGQKTRMRNALELERTSLISSDGCQPVVDVDASVTEVIQPVGSMCNSVLSPQIRVTNFGSTNITSLNIQYGLDFTTGNSFAWSGNIAPGENEIIDLPAMNSGTGSHTFHAAVSTVNGSPDENPFNNELDSEYTIAQGATLSLAVSLDYFGAETTWEFQQGGNVLASGGPYVNSNQGLVMEESICLSTGCYDFIMYDAYGDGMSFTNGSYELTDSEGTVLASGGGDFGTDITHEVCIEETVQAGNAPSCSFSSNGTSGCAGSSFNFTDTSTESPTSWNWVFEGATPASSTSQNPSNVTYGNPGTFSVSLTVSNSNGSDAMTMSGYITIESSPGIALTTSDPSCNGQSDGSISATASGTNLSYVWSNGQSGNSISNLNAGTYTVTVSSASGCSNQASATLINPSALQVSLNATPPSCFDEDNGSISCSVSGGQGPYSYDWSNGGSSNQISNLISASYSVEVTDANGCTASASVDLGQPQQLDLNLTVLNISCATTVGSANIQPTGGVGPYTIVWSTGSSSYGIENLTPGNYNVSIFDQNACNTSESFSISEGSSLNIIAEATNITCAGEENGSIETTILGGSGDYDISWSHGSSNANVSGLSAGSYTINAIDSEGCAGSETYTITEPSALSVNIFKSDITCHGESNGSAQASANGGTAPYTFEWSTGASTSEIVGLTQGDYSVTVTDSNGCSISEEVTVVEPSELTATAVVLNDESCEGSDGSAVVNVMGGTPGYSIAWSNGNDGNQNNGLSSGSYTVSVTDAVGCEVSSSLEIAFDCEAIIPMTSLIPEDCGSIGRTLDQNLQCHPIQEAQMYQWKFDNFATGLHFEAYSMGNNPSINMEEVNGLGYAMFVDVSIRVQVNDQWSNYGEVCRVNMADEVPTTELESYFCDAIDLVNTDNLRCLEVAGAYAYHWNFTSIETDTTLISYLPELSLADEALFSSDALFNVKIRAEVGAQFSDWSPVCSIQMDTSSDLETLEISSPEVLIYPNPNNGAKISIEMWNLSSSTTVIELDVYNMSGKLVENIQLSPYGRTHFKEDYRFQHQLAPGMYLIRYRSGDEVKEEKLIVR